MPVLARLFFRRATQTVVVEPPGDGIRVWLVARTDTDRSGAAFRERWRRWTRRLPVPWLVVVALLWVVAMGAVRASGAEGAWVGAVQLVPTAVLLAAAAVALDHVLSDWTPGAASAGGVAVALALHEELTRRAPERLSVGLLLCPPAAFRAWRRSERPVAADTVMVELGACGGGEVAWATRHPQLVAAAGDRGRRLTARRTPLPTIAVSTVSPGGVPARIFSSHDTADAVDEAALDAVYDFALETIDRLDASLTRTRRRLLAARARTFAFSAANSASVRAPEVCRAERRSSWAIVSGSPGRRGRGRRRPWWASPWRPSADCIAAGHRHAVARVRGAGLRDGGQDARRR